MSSLPESVNKTIAKGWSHTIPQIETLTYEWTIHKFSFLHKPNGEYFESPIFPAEAGNGEPKWSVRVFPNGCFLHTQSWLELQLHSLTESPVTAKFKLSVLKVNRVEIRSYESGTKIFSKQTKMFCSVNQFIQREFSNKCLDSLPQNTLTILCEVSIVNGVRNISGQSNIVQLNVLENRLGEDLGLLLGNEKFSDVKLVAGGHELKSHKAILAVRSKVFAAMFEHEMEEKNQNRVFITDVDHEVLKEMLCYVYTGKVRNLDTMAKDLFAAADKYDMENLKIMCEESLRNNIAIENAADTLMLADRHNAPQLKSHSITFIIYNSTSVMKTQCWKDIRTHLHLYDELLCAMATLYMH